MPKVNDSYRIHRRHQILQAALRCFAHNGFHQTSMQDLCREARLSPGAVYLYFESKESIVGALAEAGRSQTAALLDVCQGMSLSDVIAQILQQLNQTDLLPVFQLDVRLWAESIHTPELAEILRQSQSMLLDVLTRIVMSAAAPTHTRKQAKTMAQFLITVMSGFELQKVMNPEMDLGPMSALLRAALQTVASD